MELGEQGAGVGEQGAGAGEQGAVFPDKARSLRAAHFGFFSVQELDGAAICRWEVALGGLAARGCGSLGARPAPRVFGTGVKGGRAGASSRAGWAAGRARRSPA